MKTAVVTGGSKGIGFEVTRLLIEKGYFVATCSRNLDELREVEKKLGRNCLALKCDVMKSAELENFVKLVVDRFRVIDVLINNAGIAVWKDFREQDNREIEEQVRTNLEGLMKTTKYFLPYISTGGVIVNISSGAGKQGFSGLSVYCASKFGVRGFTQSLRGELKHLKIYSVNPGMTATAMTGFTGVEAEKVAKLIIELVEGKQKADKDGDFDVWEYL